MTTEDLYKDSIIIFTEILRNIFSKYYCGHLMYKTKTKLLQNDKGACTVYTVTYGDSVICKIYPPNLKYKKDISIIFYTYINNFNRFLEIQDNITIMRYPGQYSDVVKKLDFIGDNKQLNILSTNLLNSYDAFISAEKYNL